MLKKAAALKVLKLRLFFVTGVSAPVNFISNSAYTIFSDRAICMASSRLLTPSLE